MMAACIIAAQLAPTLDIYAYGHMISYVVDIISQKSELMWQIDVTVEHFEAILYMSILCMHRPAFKQLALPGHPRICPGI